ncbi:MAG: DUF3592 domain-containing protein [Rhodospirillales bacterium]
MSDATRILRILGMVFGGIGLVMIVVALIFGLREAIATEGMLPTMGQVVAYQNRKPVVRFPTSATRNVTIVGSTSSTPPAYEIGQQLRVYYDPAQPTHAVIDTYLERWFVPTLFGGFAVLFSLIGAGFVIYTTMRSHRVAWLRQNGMKVSGTIVDVVQGNVRLNRQPTWQIVAEWSTNGGTGRARSSYMIKDPRPLLNARTQIDVWVDPRNPKSAWVDTDFLDPRHAMAQAAGPVQRR